MTASSRLASVDNELGQLATSLDDIGRLHQKGALSVEAYQYSIEALGIRALAEFETFVRSLFFDAVSGDAGLRRVSSYVKPRDRAHALEIVYGDRDHLDWIPLKETILRSHRLLRFGQPFSRLELRRLDVVEAHRIVRNRIVHSGEEAERVYEKRIMQGDQSLARPAKWLLRIGPSGVPNLLLVVERMRAIARALSTDHPDLDSLLGPAEARDAGAWVPAGRYRCATCREKRSISYRSKLPAGTCRHGCSWNVELLYGL